MRGRAIEIRWLALVALSVASCGCGREVNSPEDDAAAAAEPSFAAQLEQVRRGASDRIELTATLVGDAELAKLAEVKSLRELILDAGAVTDDGLASLAGQMRLEHLRLRHSPIGDAGVQHLASLAALRIVNLPHAEFGDDGLAVLPQLPKLELLRFSSPRVTDAGLAQLAEANPPNLKFLHLIDVPITDAGLAHLERIDSLQSLYLDGASVSDEAVGRLLKAKPHLHLHLDQQHHDLDPQSQAHRH